MIDINKAEQKALKIIFADYTTEYNAHTIKEKLGVSHKYSTVVLKSLSEKDILIGKRMGKAIFYKPNLENLYTIKLMELIYTDHTQESSYVKGWIIDLKAFQSNAEAILLFGSILTKGKDARDADVCFILKTYEGYGNVEKKIKEINSTHKLKIHALHITKKDCIQKLKEGDKPLIDLVRTCVVAFGQDAFVRIVKDAQQ